MAASVAHTGNVNLLFFISVSFMMYTRLASSPPDLSAARNSVLQNGQGDKISGQSDRKICQGDRISGRCGQLHSTPWS